MIVTRCLHMIFNYSNLACYVVLNNGEGNVPKTTFGIEHKKTRG